jgi:cytoskeletal protein RodZ
MQDKKETKSTPAVAGGAGSASDATDKAADKAADKPRDKVGDMLRKERLTRRITVETIAKDLKLNVNYIKALELSDYDSLPADPYVRVYIRSLTKYLSLDSDGILKEFYKERGLISDDYSKEANKIDVSVQRQDKNPTIIVVAALIVVLAVFAFIANQKGWITPPQDIAPAVVEEKQDTAAVVDQDAARAQSDDSLLMKLNAPEEAAAKSTKAPPRP